MIERIPIVSRLAARRQSAAERLADLLNQTQDKGLMWFACGHGIYESDPDMPDGDVQPVLIDNKLLTVQDAQGVIVERIRRWPIGQTANSFEELYASAVRRAR